MSNERKTEEVSIPLDGETRTIETENWVIEITSDAVGDEEETDPAQMN